MEADTVIDSCFADDSSFILPSTVCAGVLVWVNAKGNSFNEDCTWTNKETALGTD